MKAGNLVAIGLVAAILVAGSQKPSPSPVAPAGPTDPALRAAVQPVADILAGHPEDGKRLASLYAAIADVIERDMDGKVFPDTATLRDTHSLAGAAAFQKTGLQGKYPGLGGAANKAVEASLGLDNAPLDAAGRAKAVAAFRALAWACEGGK